MSYYIAKTVVQPFDDVVSEVIELLRAEGFGVLTDIDIRAALKAKIGAEWSRYRILGACNPSLAHEALKMEDKLGVLLPCNVIVQQRDGKVEVAAVDPVASMQAVANPELHEKAALVAAKLMRVISALSD